ncbi:MAG: hypothetical protein ICV78_03600 [Tolypothrix sp. Co-bin9]|nr:hypothetical protein [Tolypothrix sp. Co-bin9]
MTYNPNSGKNSDNQSAIKEATKNPITQNLTEAFSITPYFEAHPGAKEAYENEVIRPMEKGEYPGKLADTLPNKVQAYYLFLSTGEMVCYQANGQYEALRKYFVHLIVPSEVIENEKSKRLLTKTLTNVNGLVKSVSQVVTTHKVTLLAAGVVTAIVRFFAF